jgi:hypothetical protein
MSTNYKPTAISLSMPNIAVPKNYVLGSGFCGNFSLYQKWPPSSIGSFPCREIVGMICEKI